VTITLVHIMPSTNGHVALHVGNVIMRMCHDSALDVVRKADSLVFNVADITMVPFAPFVGKSGISNLMMEGPNKDCHVLWNRYHDESWSTYAGPYSKARPVPETHPLYDMYRDIRLKSVRAVLSRMCYRIVDPRIWTSGFDTVKEAIAKDLMLELDGNTHRFMDEAAEYWSAQLVKGVK